MTSVEVVTVGRISVDLYANESGVGFDGNQSFCKSVGGSPTNVAIAAARLGRRAAIATKVGNDDLGAYVRGRLADWGVSTEYVGVDPSGQTPLALAALDNPESPSIAFYRGDSAPDTRLTEADLPASVVTECGVFWVSMSALAKGSTGQSVRHWLAQRGRATHTILDLDFRPALWPGTEAARAAAEEAMSLSTVVVGNRQECRVALGTDDPEEAAEALLSRGVSLAVVKLGGDGALLATAGELCRIEGRAVAVRCGLGAGDAFGGALCHALLSGWDLRQLGNFANAAGALVVTRLMCGEAMPTLDEITQSLGAVHV